MMSQGCSECKGMDRGRMQATASGQLLSLVKRASLFAEAQMIEWWWCGVTAKTVTLLDAGVVCDMSVCDVSSQNQRLQVAGRRGAQFR